MRPLPDTATTLERAGLTAREREVFWLVAERLRNREIAERLHIGVRTVESHVSTILRKLGVEERDGLGALATRIAPRRISGAAPPAPLSTFLGRDGEAADLAPLVRAERLVTLVGPPGVGKTRLACHVARTTPDLPPAVFVDLSMTPADEDLLRAFTAALGLDDAATAMRTALHDALGAEPAWLLVDNCEHVADGVAALLRELLEAVPDLRVLATGRSPLRIGGERVFDVRPLALPAPSTDHTDDVVLDAAACRLFLDRAQHLSAAHDGASSQRAADVADLCRRLDGLPLAIELAAAQTRWFTPAELLAQLEEQLTAADVLRPGIPDRHRTMDAAVRWSYELLEDRERRLLQRCSVFPGPFELDALAEVAAFGGIEAADVIALLPRLVERSLVGARSLPDQTTSYRLLDSIRTFARARLSESGERHLAEERHARGHLLRAVDVSAELASPRHAAALVWFDRRWPDIAAAMRWLLARDDVDSAWRFLSGVGRRWLIVGARRDVLDWMERLLVRRMPDGDLGAASRLTAAHLLCFKDTRRALDLALEARTMVDEADLHLAAIADLTTGKALAFLHRYDEANTYLERAAEFFRAEGDGWHEALALQALAHSGAGSDEALASYRRAARKFRELHDDVMLANTLVLMSTRALSVDPTIEGIEAWLAEARTLAERTENQWELPHVALAEAELRWFRGDREHADDGLHELLVTFRQMGDPRCASRCLYVLGRSAIARGDDEGAVSDLREAAVLSKLVTFPLGVASALRLLAEVDERAGDDESAARLLGRAEADAALLDPGRRSGLPDVDDLLERLAERLGERAPMLLAEGRESEPDFPW